MATMTKARTTRRDSRKASLEAEEAPRRSDGENGGGVGAVLGASRPPRLECGQQVVEQYVQGGAWGLTTGMGMKGVVGMMTDTIAGMGMVKGTTAAGAQKAMGTGGNIGLKKLTKNEGTMLITNHHTIQKLKKAANGTNTLVDMQRTPLAGGRNSGRGPDGQI